VRTVSESGEGPRWVSWGVASPEITGLEDQGFGEKRR
jgi:hypothetical protein